MCFLNTCVPFSEESDRSEEGFLAGAQGCAWQATQLLATHALGPGISKPWELPALCSDNAQGGPGWAHLALLSTEV